MTRMEAWLIGKRSLGVVTLPVIVLFVSAQQYFVEGIQMTGLKG